MIEYKYDGDSDPQKNKNKNPFPPLSHKSCREYFKMASELLAQDDDGFVKYWEAFANSTIAHAGQVDRIAKSLAFAFVVVTIAREHILELKRRCNENPQ